MALNTVSIIFDGGYSIFFPQVETLDTLHQEGSENKAVWWKGKWLKLDYGFL